MHCWWPLAFNCNVVCKLKKIQFLLHHTPQTHEHFNKNTSTLNATFTVRTKLFFPKQPFANICNPFLCIDVFTHTHNYFNSLLIHYKDIVLYAPLITHATKSIYASGELNYLSIIDINTQCSVCYQLDNKLEKTSLSYKSMS